MNIGFIGCGVVGGTTRNWFSKNTDHRIFAYDPDKNMHDDISLCHAVFISVPVPNKSFLQDLTHVENSLALCNAEALIFIRSSVTPGTCDRLAEKFNRNIIASPEFLTERRAEEDMKQNQTLFLGLSKTLQTKYENTINDLQWTIETSLFNNKKKIILTEAKTAEMGKFAHNTFGAMKVTFFNAIKDLAERDGIDYDEVLRIVLHTGFINKEHTMVPGPDGFYGYSGKCFPVNVEAMIGYVNTNPAHYLFKDIHCLNRFYRKKQIT